MAGRTFGLFGLCARAFIKCITQVGLGCVACIVHVCALCSHLAFVLLNALANKRGNRSRLVNIIMIFNMPTVNVYNASIYSRISGNSNFNVYFTFKYVGILVVPRKMAMLCFPFV